VKHSSERIIRIQIPQYVGSRRQYWYNILCTINKVLTSKQDAVITVRLHLDTFFGRDRPSSGQLRTTLRLVSWPEDGRSRPKHVDKHNLIVIIASCFDVSCVLTVHNVLYRFGNTNVGS